MMSLPFLLFTGGLAAIWAGWRGAALGLWLIGAVALLVLFRLHATDVLNIGL
jgi:hypothetical protein